MDWNRAWHFALGYVIIEASALGVERLMSLAAQSGAALYDVRRKSYTLFEAKASFRSYRKLRRAAGENAEIRILRGRGPVAWVHAIWKRWWLAVGCAVVAVALLWASGMCLDIAIEGNETIGEFEIYRVVKENGGVRFARKSDIDLEGIEEALRDAFPKLSYIYPHFSGTRLVIRVDEGEVVPELLETDPSDVVAKKGGLITSVTVLRGEAQAEAGHIVQPGDVLIAGSFLHNEKAFLVHARGEVLAQVDYIARATATFTPTEKEPTGNISTERWLELLGRRVRIDGNNPFETYIATEKVAAEIGAGYSPFCARVVEVTYQEAREAPSQAAREAAIAGAREAAYYKALSQVGEDAEIRDFSSYIEESGGAVHVTATLTTVEDIGENVPAEIRVTEESGSETPAE